MGAKGLLSGRALQVDLLAWHPEHVSRVEDACRAGKKHHLVGEEASGWPRLADGLTGMASSASGRLPARGVPAARGVSAPWSASARGVSAASSPSLLPRRPRLLRHAISAPSCWPASYPLLYVRALMPLPCRPRMHTHAMVLLYPPACAVTQHSWQHHTKVLLIEKGWTLSTWEPQHVVFQHRRPCRVSCLYCYAQSAISAVACFRYGCVPVWEPLHRATVLRTPLGH